MAKKVGAQLQLVSLAEHEPIQLVSGPADGVAKGVQAGLAVGLVVEDDVRVAEGVRDTGAPRSATQDSPTVTIGRDAVAVAEAEAASIEDDVRVSEGV
jgi:hypothetical protein